MLGMPACPRRGDSKATPEVLRQGGRPSYNLAMAVRSHCLRIKSTLALIFWSFCSSTAFCPPAPFGLEEVLKLLRESKTLDDFIDKFTHVDLANREIYQFTYVVPSNPASNPNRPQMIMRIGDVWFAAGALNAVDISVFKPSGPGRPQDETLDFLVTEEEGKLFINDKSDGLNAENVSKMDRQEFESRSKVFAEKACMNCHKQRMLMQAQDQPRRFHDGDELVFKSEEEKQDYLTKQKKLFEAFVNNPESRTDPRYRWFFDLMKLKGKTDIHARDLDNFEAVYKDIAEYNSRKMFRLATEEPNFQKHTASLLAALSNRRDFLYHLSEETGVPVAALRQEYERTLKEQAEAALKFVRSRNREITSWVLAEGKRDKHHDFMRSNYLQINPNSIRQIGMKIKDLIVDNEKFDRMSRVERDLHIPRRELGVQNPQELNNLISASKSDSEARAKVAMVADRISGASRFGEHLLSHSLVPSVEVLGHGINTLDLLLNEMGRYLPTVGKPAARGELLRKHWRSAPSRELVSATRGSVSLDPNCKSGDWRNMRPSPKPE